MRVAIIGTGNIGATIGAALARDGQDVVFGSRHPDSVDRGLIGTQTPVLDIAAALAGADAVLLALPARGLGEFLAEHAPALAGVLIVDATNDVSAPVPNAAVAITHAVPGARYARAFNTLGWENFAEPEFDGQPADLLFSAADDDRAAVEELIRAVGLRPVFLGPDRQDVVDGFLPIWFALSQQRGTRHVALRIVEK